MSRVVGYAVLTAMTLALAAYAVALGWPRR